MISWIITIVFIGLTVFAALERKKLYGDIKKNKEKIFKYDLIYTIILILAGVVPYLIFKDMIQVVITITTGVIIYYPAGQMQTPVKKDNNIKKSNKKKKK